MTIEQQEQTAVYIFLTKEPQAVVNTMRAMDLSKEQVMIVTGEAQLTAMAQFIANNHDKDVVLKRVGKWWEMPPALIENVLKVCQQRNVRVES